MTEEPPIIIEQQVPPPDALARQDRLTMVAQVIHQQFGEAPAVFSGAYSALLRTREQVSPRRTTLTRDSVTRVPFGYIEGLPSVLVIENRVGRNRQAIPSAAELARESQHVIEIIVGDAAGSPCLECRPGMFQIISPRDEVWVVARNADIPVAFYAFPQ